MSSSKLSNHSGLMYTCRSRYLIRAEVWYDDDPGDLRSVDRVLFHQRSSPYPGSRWSSFHNYTIDLTLSVEQLTARLGKDTAYKIRRARERDGIVCESFDGRETGALDHFEAMYNPFAASRGLSRLDRARMDSMAAAGALELSAARDASGNVLVWHAHHRNHQRATQMHAPSIHWKLADSAARNLIGRANRWLTWSDMMYYKEQGLKLYDFGGWYEGTTDLTLLKINEFKKGFGGRVTREYQCEQILTLKGWVALHAASWLDRIKRARPAPAAPTPRPTAVEPRKPLSAASS